MKFSRLFAAFSVSAAATFSGAAHADNWGCEVLLCLSNPAGPMAVSQCVPPITRLYRAIFKPHPDPFPTCEQANDTSRGGKGGNYARVEYNNYYDPCPAGTSALGAGANAVQGTAAQMQQQNQRGWMGGGVFTSFTTGIGEGSYANLGWGQDGGSAQKKVCVGNQLGTTTVTTGSSWDDRQTFSVNVYDKVIYLDPVMNGFAIKVWQDNTLTRVIRPQF